MSRLRSPSQFFLSHPDICWTCYDGKFHNSLWSWLQFQRHVKICRTAVSDFRSSSSRVVELAKTNNFTTLSDRSAMIIDEKYLRNCFISPNSNYKCSPYYCTFCTVHSKWSFSCSNITNYDMVDWLECTTWRQTCQRCMEVMCHTVSPVNNTYRPYT